MSKKVFATGDLSIAITARPQTVQTAQSGKAKAENALDRGNILAERKSAETVCKSFFCTKTNVLRLRLEKKNQKANGTPMTESDIINAALDAYLKHNEIPEDLRDVF